MSVVSVKVPVRGNEVERTGWCENVSQHIDAGNDVKFVDRDTNEDVEISRIQLDTNGTVNVRGSAYADHQSKALTLISGGFHRIGGIHKILTASTTTSAGIHVKI